MKIIATGQEKLVKELIHSIQGLSFAQAQKSLRTGDIKVNGKRTKENIPLKKGDEIDIYMPQKNTPKVEIVYEDENLLIVNKPSGIECATRDKSSENTYSLEEIFASHNAIVVHRLDRLTEGLVILAKSKEIASEFEQIFRTRQIHKEYLAGIVGKFVCDGIYKAYLQKDAKNNCVNIFPTPKDDTKEIITEFHLQKQLENYAILDIILHTGRTHQIRAHLKYLGYPIVNDSKYGKTTEKQFKEYNGYFLTAYKLEFEISGKLSYLNTMQFSITPSWLKYFEK